MIKGSKHSKETIAKMKKSHKGKNIKDIAGKRFGKLKAIRIVKTPKNVQRGIYWLCKCSCGNTKAIRGTSLRTGKSKSCGCGNKATRFKRNGRTEYNIVLYSYKRAAKERGLEFKLSFKTFKDLISSDCFYCGRKPSQTLGYYKWTRGFKHNGIDRIDSSLGYLTTNCVPCCKRCNFAKRDRSAPEFYEWIERIYKNLKQKGVL